MRETKTETNVCVASNSRCGNVVMIRVGYCGLWTYFHFMEDASVLPTKHRVSAGSAGAERTRASMKTRHITSHKLKVGP